MGEWRGRVSSQRRQWKPVLDHEGGKVHVGRVHDERVHVVRGHVERVHVERVHVGFHV